MWIFDFFGLLLFDDVLVEYFKVCELCDLVQWLEGQVWCLFECYGVLFVVFKVQIDWIFLVFGVVCLIQGKILVLMQVCGGLQLFNVVNQLCVLGCWMCMFIIFNQFLVFKVYLEFDEVGWMKLLFYYDWVVDVMEELFKFILFLCECMEFLVDCYLECKESVVQFFVWVDQCLF